MNALRFAFALPLVVLLVVPVACGSRAGLDDAGLSSSSVDNPSDCPAEEPGYDPLDATANACGDDKVCTYLTDPECPRVRTCSMDGWSYEDWPAEGAACTKVNKVCLYITADDGEGSTMWTYCTAASTIHLELHAGGGQGCPDALPTAGGPCPVTGTTCTFGEGCFTVNALCDATAGWQVTPQPCP
jgi:hypothetical protein